MNWLHKLLCLVGWHSWEMDFDKGDVGRMQRTCKNCPKNQVIRGGKWQDRIISYPHD